MRATLTVNSMYTVTRRSKITIVSWILLRSKITIVSWILLLGEVNYNSFLDTVTRRSKIKIVSHVSCKSFIREMTRLNGMIREHE